MKLFDLFATISLDDSGFNAGIGRAEQKARTAGQSIQKTLKSVERGAAASFKAIGNAAVKIESTAEKAFASLGVAAAGLVGTLATVGMKYNSDMESYTANFSVMLGSMEAAQARVEELRQMAASTPFGLADLTSGTQTLLAYGVNAAETTDILQSLGDIALGDANKLSTLTTVFGQISSLGKLQTQDFKQLLNVGFNPLNYIAQRTGETMEQLQDRMTAGGISIEEVKQAFKDATSAGGQFYKGMETASKTVKGLTSTLKDNASMLAGTIVQGFSQNMAADFLPKMIDYVQQFQYAVDSTTDGGKKLQRTELVFRNIIKDLTFDGKGGAKNIKTGAAFVAALLGDINSKLPELSNAAYEIVTGLWESIPKAVEQLRTSGSIVVSDILSMLIGGKATFLTAGLEIIGGLSEGILNDLNNPNGSKVGKAIGDGLVSVMGAVGKNVPQLATAAVDLFQTALGAISGEEGRTAIKNALISVADSIADLVTDPQVWDALLDAGAALWEGVWAGVSRLNDRIGDKLTAAILGDEAAEARIAEREMLNAATIATDTSSSAAHNKNIVSAALQKIIDGESINAADYTQGEFGVIEDAIKSAVRNYNSKASFDEELDLNMFKFGSDSIERAYADNWLADSGYKQILSQSEMDFDKLIEDLKKTEDQAKTATTVIESMGDALNEIPDSKVVTIDAVTTGAFNGFSTYVSKNASGLDYVPRDNYLAKLHRGEMVLTQGEANEYRRSAFAAAEQPAEPQNDNRGIAVYLDKKPVAAALKRELGYMIGNRNLQEVLAKGG